MFTINNIYFIIGAADKLIGAEQKNKYGFQSMVILSRRRKPLQEKKNDNVEAHLDARITVVKHGVDPDRAREYYFAKLK